MTSELKQHLAGYSVCITLPIQWGDQDSFAHVNNVVYFRWFESARIAYGERVGLSRLMASRQIGPILASVTCNYRRQLTYPDTVHVGARITRIGRTSMNMEHRLVSEALGGVAAEGDSTLVVFDYGAQKPTPVPDEIRQSIEQIEGRSLGSATPRA